MYLSSLEGKKREGGGREKDEGGRRDIVREEGWWLRGAQIRWEVGS